MRTLKLFWWSLQLDFEFLLVIPHLPAGEKIRFVVLKYYWFLKCALQPWTLHRVRVFGRDYHFTDGYGLASLQRVYCSSYRLRESLPPHPVILDIGANIGQFNFFCGHYLKARRVVSVEPLAFCVEVLRQNSLNPADCLEYAIAVENGPVELFIDTISSQLSSCVPDETKKSSRPVKVQGLRLDDLVKELGLNTIDLLKIDTEGNEYDVLVSGDGTLEITKAVLVEMSVFRKSAGNLFEIGHLIQSRGFVLAELFALSGRHPEDVDGFFVRA